MRSPPTLTSNWSSELHVAFSEVGIAIFIGASVAMTAVMTSLEAHHQLLGDWFIQAGAITLGIVIGGGLGWWRMRHNIRPAKYQRTARLPQSSRPALPHHTVHHP
jgi:hypothetical protein